MLHLAKLCVGCSDVADLRAWQVERAELDPPLRHRTRQMPRRAAEISDGGSLYWVVQGAMIVRQRILAIIEDRMDDGSACAGLVLDPALVAVRAQRFRPFQGWRYLPAEAAPPDVAHAPPLRGDEALPHGLRDALRELCLI